ncbi:MAG: universal stress protein [Gemmatimonadaceae bacterium]
MIRSILVPLDGSTFAYRAFPMALTLAKFHAARLAVVTVQHTPQPSRTQAAPPIDPAYEQDQIAEARKHVERVAARARKLGCRDAKSYVLEGDVQESLEGFIRDEQVDLVVMATHGRGGVSRAWLGSVSEGLLRRVHVPILLTRVKHKLPSRTEMLVPFSRALVALDGSPDSERAIDEVVRLSGTAPVHLTLAHVIPPTKTMLSPLLTNQIDVEVRRDYLEPLAAKIRKEGRSVSVEVLVDGHAAKGLLKLAKSDGSDLIVLSSSGMGGLPRFLMGSVADKVIRTSPIPVLVQVPLPEVDLAA